MSFREVTATVVHTPDVPPPVDSPTMDAWRVTLHYKGRRMTLPFYTGSAWLSEGRQPSAGDVLEHLLSDASSADEDFGNWCGSYGYDTDSRKAEAIYRAVRKSTRKLRQFLGEDFNAAVRDPETWLAGGEESES